MTRVCMSLLLCPVLVLPLAAESKNAADYPLRIHIFTEQETTFYHMRNAEESKGDGRADLYENGSVEGVDFNFDCSDQLRGSFGYQTYPAKWKKQGRELVVLMPRFGQAGSYWTCDLKTDLKPFAYARHHNGLSSEPIPEFKAWMVKRDYDPEHGKDTPTPVPPAAGAPPPAPAH